MQAISTRTLGAFTTALLAFWGLIILYSVHPGMRQNPAHLPGEAMLNTRVFLPEGWAFFTKNAEEEWLHPYKPSANGHWEPVSAGAAAEPRFLFGARRMNRSQGVEVALLLSQASIEFKPCTTDPATCLAESEIMGHLVSRTPSPT